MNRNPYAPPEAQVADPAVASTAPMQRPRTVNLAVQLMWTAMAIGALNLVLGWDKLMLLSEIPAEARSIVRVISVVMLVVSFSVYIWIIVKMGQGRNWARVVLLVLQILSLLANPFSQISKLGPLVGSIGVLSFLLEVVALVLIYLPASRPWFQPRA